ncbi:MAG: ATP-binding cassette domain-containing protein [Acidimicrobiales bacterium]
MIEARGLSKRFGDVLAVDDLTFDVKPGVVTGFLGPNGSGKSTTMAMIMGLDHPNAGSVTIAGKQYRDLRWPLREVGGLLEARAIHPGRSARTHLRSLARYNDIPLSRVDVVLDQVGLSDVASKRVGKFSLGMGQRLGIAAALLGDPGVILLDEPVNGLDPEGIRWMRTLCKSLATEGRTVFISSHMMAEMALTADQLVVIGKGRLIAEMPVADFVARSSTKSFLVRVGAPDDFANVIHSIDGDVVANADGSMTVSGIDAVTIGDAALAAHIAVYELTAQASLEDAFMELTGASVEYRGVA